jgi:hypothetical protein
MNVNEWCIMNIMSCMPYNGVYIYTVYTYIYMYVHTWLVVWNMTFMFPNSWDDDPI